MRLNHKKQTISAVMQNTVLTVDQNSFYRIGTVRI